MRSLCLVLLAIIASSPTWPDPPGDSKNASSPPGVKTPLKSAHGCLPTGDGYLRARIRGSLQLDVDLHNSELQCEGGARPNGSGIRVSFAGPLRSDGRRLHVETHNGFLSEK